MGVAEEVGCSLWCLYDLFTQSRKEESAEHDGLTHEEDEDAMT
jgi:hypothetical protein